MYKFPTRILKTIINTHNRNLLTTFKAGGVNWINKVPMKRIQMYMNKRNFRYANKSDSFLVQYKL